MQSFLKFIFVILIMLMGSANAENSSSGNKWNFYAGMFDFSDDGKKSNLFGVQHINENLYRESFLGRLQPVTGALILPQIMQVIFILDFRFLCRIGCINYLHQVLLQVYTARVMEKILVTCN